MHATLSDAPPYSPRREGTQAGTSALYRSLCLHQRVACAAHVKEPFYLSSPTTAAFLRSYASQVIPAARDRFLRGYVEAVFNASLLGSVAGARPLTSEGSTSYFESQTALDAAKLLWPAGDSPKVLLMLRNPVDRAYSHWQHDRHMCVGSLPT